MFNKKNLNKILETIDRLEKYIEDQNGNLEFKSSIDNKNYKIIEDKIIELLHKIESQRAKDMKVFGELMLVCEKISDGFTDDRITQMSSDHKINYIAKTVNSMAEKLDTTLDKTFEILNEYKEQDFRRKVDTSYFRGGRLQELLLVINNLQEGIVNRVSSSYNYGNELLSEANLLKENANILLDSSENQTQEIKQTVHSIEKISTNIQNNTKITKDMENLAHSLKESSNDSMNLINKTNDSMSTIEETTSKVTEAITVISQIAFQTNILSLNAAVEAATAGEAGKGFAVVASEVRNLANRSAEAANTIGNLITDLREKTKEGAYASTETIEKYDNLNNNIDETINMINQIVHSSTEQYNLIQNINSSVENIERVVDKNHSISTEVQKISQNNFEIASKLVEETQSVKF